MDSLAQPAATAAYGNIGANDDMEDEEENEGNYGINNDFDIPIESINA